MIQRWQTLYLFLAGVLMGFMVFLPIAHFFGASQEASEELVLTGFGFRTVAADGGESVVVVKTLAMGIVIAFAALLPLVNIFLYKKNMLQFRLCMSELVLLIGSLVFAAFYTFRAVKSLGGFEDSVYTLKLPFFFPVIASLFIILAIRGILNDIKLLKSLNRIR